jgi:hypothetical protein
VSERVECPCGIAKQDCTYHKEPLIVNVKYFGYTVEDCRHLNEWMPFMQWSLLEQYASHMYGMERK